VGVAEWTGVPLGALLERAGLRRDARDVMPWGGDELQVRRPFPVEKALLDDTLLVLDMNGEPLPEDHGFPARVLVPDWIGVANVKWVTRIEVSPQSLYSDWNTTSYVLIGPDYAPQDPALGPVLTTQTIKSAFELPWEDAAIPAGRQTLPWRSWSGGGAIEQVEVSVDDGPYQGANLVGDDSAGAWARWEFEWDAVPGGHTLRARATDAAGNSQPDTIPFNEQGYLYGGVVPHAVTVG
jgi:DMSO/TMAO reductase YedYZ molybdopterin-dependent catalytic subunit